VAVDTNTSTLNTNTSALNTNTNALTANALAGNDTLFKQYGFDSFISKPIDIRQLNAVLNTYVRDTHPEEAEKWKFELPSQIRIKKEVDPKLLKMFVEDMAYLIEQLKLVETACTHYDDAAAYAAQGHFGIDYPRRLCYECRY
jgi:DNA-binding response OmpR family regulator